MIIIGYISATTTVQSSTNQLHLELNSNSAHPKGNCLPSVLLLHYPSHSGATQMPCLTSPQIQLQQEGQGGRLEGQEGRMEGLEGQERRLEGKWQRQGSACGKRASLKRAI